MVIVSFPSNLIASIFNFKSEEFFDAEEGIEKPVEVKFQKGKQQINYYEKFFY